MKGHSLFDAESFADSEFDNNEIITRILQLRKERVELLGYNSFAEWQLVNRMAKTPENAFELMLGVWPAAS